MVEGFKDTYHLGPTGLRGWIHKHASYATPSDFEAFFTTKDSRQILVTQVDEGSPADGQLKVGDVIIGAGEGLFQYDVRKAWADAIDDAETAEKGGVLRVLRWRSIEPRADGSLRQGKGTEEWVDLKLRVLGSYSQTAPYDCEKSGLIVNETAEWISKGNGGARLNFDVLGLLATGEEKFVKRAKEILDQRKIARQDLKLSIARSRGHMSWGWSYNAVILAEYYLMTGDESVLPALREYAVSLAMGQSNAGNWGQTIATLSQNRGKMHGRLAGYGALNQVGLICYMALIYAERCGISHPEITKALAKSDGYFGYFAGKGAIPYGYDHPLPYMLTNNGMSGSAALAFGLRGDRGQSKFYSLMSAAAHEKTEVGHTGTFFGTFWTPLGANLAGPEVCAEFFRQHRWLHTLARSWKGGFVYQAPGGRFGGSRDSYSGISSAAAHLMFYSVPRRALFLTGKKADRSFWLKGDEAKKAVGVSLVDYSQLEEGELFGYFGAQIPMVRLKAVDELLRRGGSYILRCQGLLKTGRVEEKIAAIDLLAKLGRKSIGVQDDLVRLVNDPNEDLWVRNRAIRALGSVLSPTLKDANLLLDLGVSGRLDDTRGDLERELAIATAKVIKDPYPLGVDRKRFYQVIRKYLKGRHHLTRTAGVRLMKNIPINELHLVSEDLVELIRGESPDFVTYHADADRGTALSIFERLGVEDGVALSIETIEPGRWGQKWRLAGKETGRFAILRRYGGNAQSGLPALEEMADRLGESGRDLIEFIKTSPKVRTLVSLEELTKLAGEEK